MQAPRRADLLRVMRRSERARQAQRDAVTAAIRVAAQGPQPEKEIAK